MKISLILLKIKNPATPLHKTTSYQANFYVSKQKLKPNEPLRDQPNFSSYLL